ncbi:MAG: hydantoinase/oxoprolinase family protein [Pyrinomonadaceae bacterium]
MPKRKKPASPLRVGVDTGGTFTDFVFQQQGHLEILKLPSTPSDPSTAILEGLNRIRQSLREPSVSFEVVHGTTVGTNALLQRRGARTALITTKGFEDVLAIGRQARPELYNLNATKPPSLVPDELRIGVAERVASNGEVLQPLEQDELARVIKRLQTAGVESVAISLLFSFAYPEHEKEIAAAVRSLDLPTSISHSILPEYREYERTSTTVINAYLQPLMGRYLNRLAITRERRNARIPSIDLRVMQSSGGSISARVAAAEPVRTILSGPAGGVVGALQIAHQTRIENIITFDMGGTSTDVALCVGRAIRSTNESNIAGMPVAISMMDIHTVGAGGGSIARVDEGGSLRVGPQSAGADPGPACYGRSSLPTVTDAHVVLGHFGEDGLLGGEFSFDNDRAREAMSELASEVSRASGKKCSVAKAAEGVIAVSNTSMEHALRYISVERGHDPRQFVLLPFGGAGGLHAVDLAGALGIPLIICPASPGALSAFGVLSADVVRVQTRTVMLGTEPSDIKKLMRVYSDMEHKARRLLRREGFPLLRQQHKRSLAMRYRGQSFELELPFGPGNMATKFHESHKARYGYSQPNVEVEIVNVRLRSSGLVKRISTTRGAKISKHSLVRPHYKSEATLSGIRSRVGFYRRAELTRGSKLQTPCIVTEYSATTLIPEFARATVDGFGNLVIALRSS